MDALTEYEVLRGYRLSAGWTREMWENERPSPEAVPLAIGGGAVAWGVPYLLQFVRPGMWESLDRRFEVLSLGAGEYEVEDAKAPTAEATAIVRSINEAEAWARERARFSWIV